MNSFILIDSNDRTDLTTSTNSTFNLNNYNFDEINFFGVTSFHLKHQALTSLTPYINVVSNDLHKDVIVPDISSNLILSNVLCRIYLNDPSQSGLVNAQIENIKFSNVKTIPSVFSIQLLDCCGFPLPEAEIDEYSLVLMTKS